MGCCSSVGKSDSDRGAPKGHTAGKFVWAAIYAGRLAPCRRAGAAGPVEATDTTLETSSIIRAGDGDEVPALVACRPC